ncbi:MAG: hypothetical protein H7A41_04355 [Chlamydiales bacterium]|nr:hypothetical protein [Chlamydiales bacterium]
MTESIQSNCVCAATEAYEASQETNQELVNQLLMFILGCNSGGHVRGESPQEELLKQELARLETSLPPQKAGELQGMLDRLPTDTSSKNYFTELTIAFTQISAFVASNIPNGLSPKQQEALNNLLANQPVDQSSKNYWINVAIWAAQVARLIASDLPGVLSPSAKQELDQLFTHQPNNPEDKVYPLEMIQFLAQIQVFIAESIPSPLSPADKAQLVGQLKELQSINLNDKVAPEEVELASAKLELLLSKMFFN